MVCWRLFPIIPGLLSFVARCLLIKVDMRGRSIVFLLLSPLSFFPFPSSSFFSRLYFFTPTFFFTRAKRYRLGVFWGFERILVFALFPLYSFLLSGTDISAALPLYSFLHLLPTPTRAQLSSVFEGFILGRRLPKISGERAVGKLYMLSSDTCILGDENPGICILYLIFAHSPSTTL